MSILHHYYGLLHSKGPATAVPRELVGIYGKERPYVIVYRTLNHACLVRDSIDRIERFDPSTSYLVGEEDTYNLRAHFEIKKWSRPVTGRLLILYPISESEIHDEFLQKGIGVAVMSEKIEDTRHHLEFKCSLLEAGLSHLSSSSIPWVNETANSLYE